MSREFRNQPWEKRFKSLGDIAERAFERNNYKWTRTGFNRPQVTMKHIPKHVCYMPDYCMDNGPDVSWYEVQGCGKDQTFKFKDEKLDALEQWSVFTNMQVYFWLWDDHNQRHVIVHLAHVVAARLFNQGERGEFPEGKQYTALTWDQLSEWAV